MILSDKQARFLRWGTVVVFAATFVVALVNVYGYRFDSNSQSLVKKSVIVFDTPVSEYTVSVNGIAQGGVKNELRLVPGRYELSLAQENNVEWKKKIDLKEDELMRLGRPWLLPREPLTPVDANLVFEKNWVLVMNTEYWLAFKIENKSFTARLFNRESKIETRFALKGFVPKSPVVKMAYDSTAELLYLLTADHKITSIDVENLVVNDKRITARDLTQFNEAVVYVNDKGVLTVPGVNTHFANGVTLESPYELQSIEDVEIQGNAVALSMKATDSANKGKNPLVFDIVGLLDSNGTWKFLELGTLAHFENDELVYSVRGEFVSYNPTSDKTEKRGAIVGFESPITLRQIGKTFWRIMVTKSGKLRVCDAWGENCIDIGSTLSSQIITTDDGFIYDYIDSPKKGVQQIRVVNLDPAGIHQRTFTGILTDIIQETHDSLSSVTSSKATEREGTPIE